MMLCDIDTYLKEDILAKVDRAAMFNSLETRAPFLNHTAMEAWRFPDDMLYEKTRETTIKVNSFEIRPLGTF